MKVFELAKELNIGAVDLVEKLRGSGFNVRNHMVKLSEEDLSSARKLFDTTPAIEPAKKKKVTKKKVAKKKVVKKVAKPTEETQEAKLEEVDTAAKPAAVEEAADGEPKKKVLVKRKKVIRKSATKTASELKEQAITKLQEVAKEKADQSLANAKTPTELPKKEKYTEDIKASTGGLEIISRPEEKKAPLEQVEARSSEEVDEKSKSYLKESMHTFTPIFIPKESDKPQESKSSQDSSNPAVKAGGAPSEDDKLKERSKKRMGDLAAIVSKKAVGNRSEKVTQLRADEELKLANTLSGTTVYTPLRRKKVYSGPTKQTKITQVKDSKRVVQFHEGLTCAELAVKLSVKFLALQKKTAEINLLIKKDDYVGPILIEEIAALFDYRSENVQFDEVQIINEEKKKTKSEEKPRAPIVTIMGHVDHGKTTLLDQIRKSKVVDSEAGGITQHTAAYSVSTSKGTITFLDTPGHAAFAGMRERGASLTDVVILVVAADDGIMPQTIESIKFCQANETPIIVAINKMDKEGANPDKVKQTLIEFNLTSEEWGGDTQFVPISALKGDGIDDLLEAISLQAEIMELTASDKGAAEGIVVESKIETGRGPIATLIIQKGKLKKGDAIVVGETSGRARSLMDHFGKNLKEAGPSTPVQILGLTNPASPGETFNVVKNEREAIKIAQNRVDERKKLDNTEVKKVASLEDFFSASSSPTDEKKILKLIVRTDVQGTFEAIKKSLEAIGNDEVGVNVISGGVGAITDSDVVLAAEAAGYIFGFNMRPVTSARKLSEEKGVDVKTYSIIYEMINDVKLACEGLLEPEKIEKYIGRAEVRQTFSIPKIGTIAGTSVIDGKIQRGCNIRLLREGKIMFDGKLSTLKRFKDEVKEVSNGYECGMALENYQDIRTDDIFEAYILEEKARTLDLNEMH
jgi:translation initiation factor IF-2